MALSEVWAQARQVRQSDVPWSLAVFEFRIHAARNAGLNRRYQVLHEGTLHALAGMFEELAVRTGLPLQYRPMDFARFMAILYTGGLLELAGIDPERFRLDELQSLPTMTKMDMMEAFDEVVTERRLTLDRVQAHLATTTDFPRLLEGDNFAITSGGSSGVKRFSCIDQYRCMAFAQLTYRESLRNLSGFAGVWFVVNAKNQCRHNQSIWSCTC